MILHDRSLIWLLVSLFLVGRGMEENHVLARKAQSSHWKRGAKTAVPPVSAMCDDRGGLEVQLGTCSSPFTQAAGTLAWCECCRLHFHDTWPLPFPPTLQQKLQPQYMAWLPRKARRCQNQSGALEETQEGTCSSWQCACH